MNLISILTKKVIKYYLSLSMKEKLLISYSILIILPMIILPLFSYRMSTKIIQHQVMDLSNDTMNQTSAYISYRIGEVNQVSNIVAYNAEVQEVLKRDVETYEIGMQIDDSIKIQQFLKRLEQEYNFYRIRLYVRENLIYSNENTNFFNLEDIKETEINKIAVNSNGKIFLTSSYAYRYINNVEQDIISSIRLIKDLKDIKQSIGFLSIDILQSEIIGIIENATAFKTGRMLLYNSDEDIIIGTGVKEVDEMILDVITDENNINSENNWYEMKIENENVITRIKSIQDTNWNLAIVIPMSDILHSSTLLRNNILLITLIIGGISYFMVIIISNYNTKRIKGLTVKMREAVSNDLDVRINIQSRDEIGELEQDFIEMILQMKIMMEEKYNSGQDAKNYELKALQEQINPHFLYNTLDLINWKAIEKNAPEISILVSKLAHFYRLSLSKGKEIITIDDEIKHIRIYTDIQKMRFKNQLKFEIDIHEDIKTYSTLKLILQPLVENSIIHGIFIKENKSGIIRINGWESKGNIILCVEDDGIGIDSEKLSKILGESKDFGRGGFGIKNIDDRIKLKYGSEYGLKFKSKVGIGTTVKLKFPAIKYSEENS